MSLLAEYAITPDVFDASSYANDEAGDLRLQRLKEVLLNEGLVRDLRNGGWSELFAESSRPWHSRGKELLKKLKSQNRLRCFRPALSDSPASDSGWCREAVASSRNLPLAGIVVTSAVSAGYGDERLVAAIDRLDATSWWKSRCSSERVPRNCNAYALALRPLLDCANSIMFIDAHINPEEKRYRDFLSLILATRGRTPAPTIEVHRVCWFSSKDRSDQRDEKGWRAVFSTWDEPLRSAGIGVEVFVWDNFHNRFVISDLVGIQTGNSFDTTTDPSDVDTWTRLDRRIRDEIQREFDPAAKQHTIKHRIKLGANC